MTDKKFAVAGWTTLNGKTKLRFANDIMRFKILNKKGHKDIELITLPYEMTKGEIAEYFAHEGLGSNLPEVQAAIRYIAKKNPIAPQELAQEGSTITA